MRWVWGVPLGPAWGLACLGAGLRWGSLGLADVQAATGLLGPTLGAGPPLVVAGAGVMLAAAALEEAAGDGLRARALPVRAASGAALLALVPAFCAPGWGGSSVLVTLAWWLAGAAALGALALSASGLARRVPGWAPAAAAAAGLLMVAAGAGGWR